MGRLYPVNWTPPGARDQCNHQAESEQAAGDQQLLFVEHCRPAGVGLAGEDLAQAQAGSQADEGRQPGQDAQRRAKAAERPVPAC